MFKNFFTLALRNLMKRKLYSFINIFGLAISVAVCLVILQYVDFELSYDHQHTQASQIYRTVTIHYQGNELRSQSVVSSYAQGPALQTDMPEVKTYVRTHPMYGGAVVSYTRPSGDPSTFREDDLMFADSTFFDVFTHQVQQGDLRTALQRPASVVITREVADKYFRPGEEPLGKVLKVSGGWADGDYEVTAVIDNIPGNSHFRFDMLFPTHNLLQNEQYKHDDGWGWNNFVTYVVLHPQANLSGIQSKMPAFVTKYHGKRLDGTNARSELSLQPLLDIHLTPGLNHDGAETTNVNTIYFFILIAVFILAIAWINYINLSTARAMERAREVGIKKSLGAFRTQVAGQFMLESLLVNGLAVLLAALLAVALLPVLAAIVNKPLAFQFSDYRYWLVLTGLFFVGTCISGAYPAFVLSSFRITEVIKGKVEKVGGGFSLRKALVVFQFAASLVLIAGTFAVYRQMTYMRSQDKGLTMEQMLIIDGPSIVERTTARQRLISLKEEIRQIPGVRAVTTSGAIPGGGYNWGTQIRRDGATRDEEKTGSIVWVDPDFVNTYGITVLAGRVFDPAIRSDMESVLINEAAVTAMGLGTPEQALEQRVIFGDDTVAIVGVLKNYHWNSLKADHSPWLFKADTISSHSYSVLLSGNDIPGTIAKIEEQYKALFPGNPFDYYFLDDFFDRQYRSDQQFGNIIGIFSMLAILIACLGLWGLAAFTTTQKLKEIGIRKVLGASVPGIVSLLSWQFLRLVCIASVLAIPITWYGINAWLQGYAFRIALAWDLFVIPTLLLGLIALGTVSIQIIRGAYTNPATTLRNE